MNETPKLGCKIHVKVGYWLVTSDVEQPLERSRGVFHEISQESMHNRCTSCPDTSTIDITKRQRRIQLFERCPQHFKFTDSFFAGSEHEI